jgi:TolB-like protein/Flp pilus assembly protein TadD/predicted Ser/Thr protein kinase
MPLAPNARFAAYEILAFVGAGGMGEVWRARDTRLGREVALKVLPAAALSDETARARLQREARTASKLNHPDICTVYDVGEAEGQTYIAMEFVEGRSLADRLRDGALPLDQILLYGQQVAEALAHAHEHGIVHRDLKSANVMITPDGRAKVLDFGLAKRAVGHDPAAAPTLSEPSLTAAGALAGTLAYMAPEQLLGRPADERSDIWALGVVLYEMATGTLPFRGTLSTAVIDDIIHKEPPAPGRLRHDLPPRIEQAILKCLEKEQGNRYQSAKELLVDLRRLSSPAAAQVAHGRASVLRNPLVTGAIAVLAISVLGVTAYLVGRRHQPSATPPAGKVMLAVLPVDNLSGDPGQEYFSDGLTEEMIAQLGQLQPKRLGVIARTSAMHYKRTQKPIDEIGRELGVDYILESSVRREGKRVRITAQLIQVRDQTHLWAESYERDLAGVFAVQSDVAERIARSLAVELIPAEQPRLTNAKPPNPEAYELYLKGRYHWNKRTANDLLKATEYFRAAIGLDPSYAVAYAGLGDSYALYSFYYVLTPRESFPQARAAAQKALQLDANLIEAETTLAFVALYYDWDWAAAETQLKRVLEIQPSYAIARQWYAEYLSAMGRPEAALAEIRRAQEADPLSPLMKVMEAYVYNYSGQYKQAVEACKRALPLDPNYALTYSLLGFAYGALGMHDEALAAYRRGSELAGEELNVLSTAVVYARSGRRLEATRILDQILAPGWKGERPAACAVAMTHAALGHKDEAIAWLEKAYDQRESQLVRVRVDYRYEPLHSDPRFQDLIRRMNFPHD